MITLTALSQYLDAFMIYDKTVNLAKIDPQMTNGMMVRGKEEIKKIGFGVSASVALFQKAAEQKCDCIIVHHSFNQPPNNRYDSIFQNRIGYLILNSISLFGFHFLLDAHPQVGNNIQILKAIGALPEKPYLHRGNPWGWVGEFSEECELAGIVKILLPHLSKRTLLYNFGPKKIKKVVIVSGKGAPFPQDMQELMNEKIDLFVTGEIHEWNRELFKEAKINCIAGGHYATEKYGIMALSSNIHTNFKESVDVEWLDLDNEV